MSDTFGSAKSVCNLDFIGIGTIRGASTWLHKSLQAHPEICMSEPKETSFFAKSNATDELSLYDSRYLGHCSGNGVKYGEFTPSYMKSPFAMEQIKTLCPEAKLIVCLRNPVERAYSHFLKHKLKGKDTVSSFDTVVDKKIETYISPGFYYTQLSSILGLFPANKLHIIFFEDIQKKPELVLEELYKFIGVDSSFRPSDLKHKINAYGNRSAKFIFVNKIIYTLERFSCEYTGNLSILRTLKKPLYKLKEFIKRMNMVSVDQSKHKPQISTEQYNMLLDFYRDDITKLEQLLSRDLTSWKQTR